MDAEAANAVLNHPDVLPETAPRIDVSPLIADSRNVVLAVEGGCIIFAHCEPGRYELHLDFLRECRGRYARDASDAALRLMFLSTDCGAVEFKIPAANRAACWGAARIGARREFDRAGMSFWRMTYADWLRRQPDLVAVGRTFVADVATECARLGSPLRDFADDDQFFQRLGAAVETISAGQVEKGVVFYNRWAGFVLAPGVALVAREPLVLCFGGVVLLLAGRTVRALRCL